MEKRIVTLTINPALDKITGIKHVRPNQKLRCNQPNHEPGGGGINVSRAINRLGGESLALYPAGGPNGEAMKRLLDEEGIQHDPIPIHDQIRENITVFESEASQQYRFIMPGPEITEKELENVFERIKSLDPRPNYLVASGSIPAGVPEDFYQQVVDLTDEMDCRTIVDTSGEPLRLASQSGVYLLKPNMRELGNLAGKEIESEAHQMEAARTLIDEGQAEVVVVSLGAGGALLVTQEGGEHFRTPTVPIRSKLGAGDSMVAGIVLSLAQDHDIRRAVMYGIAAGAAAVMTPGTDLCTKSDTDRLFERIAAERDS
jgi:6-phosphofructokinase 2